VKSEKWKKSGKKLLRIVLIDGSRLQWESNYQTGSNWLKKRKKEKFEKKKKTYLRCDK
jgi:hypothetical protein